MSRYWCSVIAYDAASLKYKVVVIYDRSWINIVHDCAILTVGVDKSWRDVNTQHISERNSWLLCCNVLITQGFVHWHSGQGTHVINLNLETEVLTEIRIPQGYDEQGSKYYLSTERSLTLFIECGRFLWDVWEMMNAEESGGEWTKVFKIDMEGPMWRLQKMMIHTSPHNLKPNGWLCRGVVLVFHIPRPTRVCVVYDVRTREVDFFMLTTGYGDSHDFTCHRSTLVSLGGCSCF